MLRVRLNGVPGTGQVVSTDQSGLGALMLLILTSHSEKIDWDTHRGAVIKRVYWTCNLIEKYVTPTTVSTRVTDFSFTNGGYSWYHFDLDLPQTGIGDYEDQVPLPGDNFGDRSIEAETVTLHFLAIIALRRLISRIHAAIFDGTSDRASDMQAEVLTEGFDNTTCGQFLRRFMLTYRT